jgi:hypothetical protein
MGRVSSRSGPSVRHPRTPSVNLIGRIFDDRGNRMTPSTAKKGPLRYHYYVSCVLAQGRSSEAGVVARVPASEIEAAVVDALRTAYPDERQRTRTGAQRRRSPQSRPAMLRKMQRYSAVRETARLKRTAWWRERTWDPTFSRRHECADFRGSTHAAPLDRSSASPPVRGHCARS